MKRILYLALGCCLLWSCEVENLHEQVEVPPMEDICQSLGLTAEFEAQNIGCIAPCAITFDASNSLNAETYAWDFGDGTISTEFIPDHFYFKGGSYTVTLKTTAMSCETTISRQVNIVPNTFQRIYTVPQSGEVGVDGVQTSDCGFMVLSNNPTGLGSQVYLTKTDIFGDSEQWGYAYFNIHVSNTAVAKALVATAEGDYTMLVNEGIDGDFPFSYMPVLKKVSLDGTEVWHKDLAGGPAEDVITTIDGGYLVVGTSTSETEIFIQKLDEQANMIWERQMDIGEELEETLYAVSRTSDGGYIITGEILKERSSRSGPSIIVLKIDGNGNLLWQQQRESFTQDRGNVVVETTDGNYVIGGHTVDSDGEKDIILLKYSTNGILLWERTIGGGESDTCEDLLAMEDGGLMIVGSSSSFSSSSDNSDIYLVRTDGNGNELWSKSHDFQKAEETASAIIANVDGGFTTIGSTDSLNVLLLKTDEQGNVN